jgi:hypothetical protein
MFDIKIIIFFNSKYYLNFFEMKEYLNEKTKNFIKNDFIINKKAFY